MSADPFLAAFLSTLIPGNADWPGAGETTAPVRFATRLAEVPALAMALDAQRSALPGNFASLGAGDCTRLLVEREAADPRAFALLLTEAYMAYYSDTAVLQAIERRTGFPSAPPQPGGRHLDPFDWSFLDGRKSPVKPA